jgi:tRNA pseudouridine38-40 synthase
VARFLLRVAYDGTGYVGWQRQRNGVSVQQRLEEAAAPLSGFDTVVVAAGRTDTGVHALGQAAHVDLPAHLDAATIQRALNSRLPPDIRVRRVDRVADHFHARYSAAGKTYRYRWLLSHVGIPLHERDAWRVSPPLDIAAMREAAIRIVGVHEFAGFQSTGTVVASTVREITSVSLGITTPDDDPALGLDEGETRLDLRVTGNGFLRHMVRTIAGTLTEVGRGRCTPEHIDRILEAGDRALAGPTAPAHGLTLMSVAYRDT